MSRLLLFVVAFLLAAPAVQSQISFAVQPYPTPMYSGSVCCVGDVNSDGRNDVVVATVVGNNTTPLDNFVLKFYMQTPLGTLAAPFNIPYKETSTMAWNTAGIDIADFNNDGRNDVVYGFNDSVGIMFQDNVGGFLPRQNYYAGSGVNALKSADFNGDGLADIAVAFQNDLIVRVFYQTSTGFTSTFFPAPSVTIVGASEIETGDVNGDGLLDIVLLRGQGVNYDNLFVYTQNSSGTFNPYVAYTLPVTNTYTLRAIETVDLNSDGLMDVVGTRGSFNDWKIVTWLQDPVTHLLQSPTESVVSNNSIPIEAADLNCNGIPELVTMGSQTGGVVTVVSMDSVEGLGNPTTFSFSQASGLQPQALSLGDFTGDGKIDIALADFNYGLITMHNTSPFAGSGPQNYAIVTIDTLTTTISTQQYYYQQQHTFNNGNGYLVTQTDSFKVATTTRLDSLQIDSMKINKKFFCPNIEIDTTYSTTYTTVTHTGTDTTLIRSRRDSLATGVRSIATIPGLRVYPVPAGVEVKVQAAVVIEGVEVFSLAGQRLQVPVRRASDGWLVDVSGLAPGMYQLQVERGGKSQMLKIARE